MIQVNGISRSTYERAVAELILPDNVIATKPDSTSRNWSRGDARDAAHNVWWLSDRNPNLIEKTKLIVRFDTPMAPNGILLSDESFLSQSLTKRIYAIHGLEFGIRDEAMSCQTLAKHCDKLDWVYRWMWSENLSGLRIIQDMDFRTFTDTLGHGVAAMVPLSDRLRSHIVAVHRAFEAPDWLNWKGNNTQIDWTLLARELGVTTRSLDDASFRLDLVDEIASTFSLDRHALTSALSTTTVKRKPTSVSTYEQWLGVWDDLYRMSSIGLLPHDALAFNPFANSTVKQTAEAMGKKRNPTPTLPPEFLLTLMDKAVPWVFDYSAWIIRSIKDAKAIDDLPHKKRSWARIDLADRLNRERPTGAPKVWPSWRSEPAYSECFILSDLIQFLLLACAVLISSFGARRLNETLNIRKGCISQTKRGKFELSIYIEKTLQAVDNIPVPAMVAGVVDVLEKITKFSRAFTGKDWLFEVIRKDGLGDTYQRSSNLKTTFKKFTKHYGISAPEGMDDWQLASHQLRRGFAISYYYGSEIRDLDALSWFMRHFDPEMTRVYIKNILPGQIARLEREMTIRRSQMRASLTDTDKKWFEEQERVLRDLRDRGQTWEGERQGAIAFRLMSLVNVTDSVVGPGAPKLEQKLTELIARASTRVRVGGRSNKPAAFQEALVNEFMRFAATHYLDPVPGGHSLCSFGPEDEEMKDAACLLLQSMFVKTQFGTNISVDSEGPDFRFSGLHPCLQCQYCVKMEGNVRTSQQIMNDFRDASAKGATKTHRESSQAILDDLIRMTSDAAVEKRTAKW